MSLLLTDTGDDDKLQTNISDNCLDERLNTYFIQSLIHCNNNFPSITVTSRKDRQLHELNILFIIFFSSLFKFYYLWGDTNLNKHINFIWILQNIRKL